MKRAILPVACFLLSVTCFVGCVTDYRWTSTVPDAMRTIAVPNFRNESDVTELGDVVTTQLLREIQREGTFKIRRKDDAAVEVQGVIKSVQCAYAAGDRRSGMRLSEYSFIMAAEVSVVDRVNGRVLVNNRPYTAMTTFVANQDMLTGQRNASGRAAEELARQVVDDLTSLQW